MMERMKFISECEDAGLFFHGWDKDKERWEINDLTILVCPVDGQCEYFQNSTVPESDDDEVLKISGHRAAERLIEDLPADLVKVLAIQLFKKDI